MPTSEARILANQANAARSTGPRTEAGKARSRANALKHGLTGDGVVVPEEDAAEVERLTAAFLDEMAIEGEIGRALARRMAVMAVRMERSATHELAALGARVRQTLDEFEAPEGVDAAEAERLRVEASRLALFDPSKEANLARKYDAAAHRGFFQALKELQQRKKTGLADATAADLLAEDRASLARLGSFLPETPAAPKPATTPPKPASAAWDPFAPTHFDLPIAIGRAR